MAHAEVKHDYHLVDPSPWPLLASLGLFILAVGAVTFMKGLATEVSGEELTFFAYLGNTFFLKGTPWILMLGALVIIWVMFGWWGDVIKESRAGDHTPVVQIGLRYGMILFIMSEVMFFVAWFWSFFELAIFHTARAGATWDSANPLYEGLSAWANWPPPGVETFDPFHLPLINTLILLLSGTTVTWAHHALLHDDRDGARNGLVLTVLLGAIFSCVQIYEYTMAGFTFSGSLYGASFFMATGFHGAHVFIGTVFLLVCLIRILGGQMSAKKHIGFEAAAWYWHFVDVVWLFLFAFVYVTPQLVLGNGH
ncbi:cytochrome c oxidase subunit 3 [Ponticaulis sp.]|uniref:cytochrome c oxidase subunit 3 n=1 Tax=Ponticaulis sp. TaxID=2020902 RepID=UPI000B66C74C|nr:cytochrome c oxidase subunit 3 [Ponticaulis sp.]MAI90841.1 cytochrome c oxidase subunit 3 [Ponticaulis sp.]OUX98816.1 MAG: cytochrome c oxidase subunit 3 [Hyphomonadaceae bacterium TMED5]|tara:strand:- start:2402 stop:3328 length:927 start_codon:yes stop_codon:yes gene_type:complete